MTRPWLVIGHRGARGLFPENTLPGFIGALALGVDALELDVVMTADGMVVVSHDPALNADHTRDASGRWLSGPGKLIRSMRLAEVSKYDVGRLRPWTAYAAQFPRQQPRDGARIPTLAEVLRLNADFVIELKTFPDRQGSGVGGVELALAVAAVADAAGVTRRITVEGFDWRGPRHLRQLRPDIRLAWLTRAETVRNAVIWWGGPRPDDFGGSVPRAVAAEGGPIWAPDHRDLSAELVAEAHSLGLLVMPWTVNQVSRMRRLLGWGVDGFVTDRPDLAHHLPAAPQRHNGDG